MTEQITEQVICGRETIVDSSCVGQHSVAEGVCVSVFRSCKLCRRPRKVSPDTLALKSRGTPNVRLVIDRLLPLAMIVRPGQPSRMYSLSMASGGSGGLGASTGSMAMGSSKLREARETKAKTKARPGPGPFPGPSNTSGRAPRRESPLAAAARRAREAMAGTPASRERKGPGSQRQRSSSGLAPKLRKPQLGAEPPPPTPCTPESPLRSETQKPGFTGFAARSLIRSHGSPDRDLEKHPSRRPPGSCSPESPDWKNGRRRPSHANSEDHDLNADFANSSVGSAPIDVSWEDMAAKSAERAEILEAAAVLRREAQDLGQALRAWVGVEAEPERSAPEEPASLFAPLASEPEEIDEEPHKAPVGAGADAGAGEEGDGMKEALEAKVQEPELELLPEPECDFGEAEALDKRERLLLQRERLDNDLERIAGEWHRVLAERQQAIEALAATEYPAVAQLSAPVPMPVHARATLGSPVQVAMPTMHAAPLPARATVPLRAQEVYAHVQALSRSPSPAAAGTLFTACSDLLN
eukprot:s5370_g6.t1